MAYWWVMHKVSQAIEISRGSMWAPKPQQPVRDQFHWRLLESIERGDIIFSWRDGAIRAVFCARSGASDEKIPEDRAYDVWRSRGFNIGRSVTVKHELLPTAITLEEIAIETKQSLAAPINRYGPLDSALQPNQGYLFRVSDKGGHALVAGFPQMDLEPLARVTIEIATSPTEREIIATARIGQGDFRKDLLHYWAGSCAASSLSNKALLRASHIKSWSDSNDVERLDPYNGLLLSVSYDAAFDSGLISFTDEGNLLMSSALKVSDAETIGISADARLSRIDVNHRKYLHHHRVVNGF